MIQRTGAAPALQDPERLDVLQATGLLQEGRVDTFDRIARAATHALHAPVAQVNLITADRQIPKACFGPESWMSAGAVSLDHSYCQHVIATGDPMAIADARTHPLTRDSCATVEAGIGAYAGVPLTTAEGFTLGTLCVVDFQPREWTADELEILRDLGDVATAEIEERLQSGERAQAALLASEARYRTLAEVNPNGIVEMDDTGTIVSVNPAIERIFGYRADELIGQPLARLVPERFREAHQKGVQRYLATGRRNIPWTGVELPGLTKSGREIPTEISFGDYVLNGRHVFAGFIHDISERKREEARRATEHAVTRILAEAEGIEEAASEILGAICKSLQWSLAALWQVEPDAERLRVTELWHSPDVAATHFARSTRDLTLRKGEGLPGRVWATGRALWIEDVGRDPNFPRARAASQEGLHGAFAFPLSVGDHVHGVIEVFNRDLEVPDESLLRTLEAIGSEIGQFIERKRAEDARDQALSEALAARRRAEEQATEMELQAEQLQLQAAQLEEAQAELETAMLHLQQINSQLEARTAEAEQAQAAAEEASHAKSQFLANMSHELRTPINAVVGYTDLLEMGIAGPLTDKQRAHLERIKSSSQHLLTLVSEVLDLAKVESGQMKVQREQVPLREVIDHVVGLIAPLAARSGVELQDEIDATLDTAFIGDRDRVRQILTNLVSNAVKFTDSGGRVRIRCSIADQPGSNAQLQRADSWVRVEVEDTGIGIAPEHRDQIFEPFFQVDGGYTRESGGTGLGLSISRQLARLMGGDLTVESTPGEGSRFSLWLAARSSAAAGGGDQRVWPITPHEVPRLSEVGRVLVRCANEIVEKLGDALREDPATPQARHLNRAQLENHFSTFLVDIGLALLALDEGGGEPALLRDGTDIQRVIAERHGAQRARLDWDEAALRREFQILQQVVERTLRQNLPAVAGGSVEAATSILRRLLEQAQRVSCQGWRRSLEAAS